MAPDHVWSKWELVLKRYESGELIDLDTGKEVKQSSNFKELTNLHNIQSTSLRGLTGLSPEQLERAADHILAKPPRIYMGKHPRCWTRAQILDKWCERRKLKDVVIKAIGDRYAYIKKSDKNIFLDDKGNILRQKWLDWKDKRHFNSCIMDSILRSNGMHEYMKLVINASKKTPKYPPKEALVRIDQAFANRYRASDNGVGRWSVFVLWRLESFKLSDSTGEYGVGGRLAQSTRPFVPKMLTAAILDLRHCPLFSKDSEITTSWHEMTKQITNRCGKMGLKHIKCWMIIAPSERQSNVDIMRMQFFQGYKRMSIHYFFQNGEPFGKTKDQNVSITYLERKTILSNGEPKYFSDEVGEENFYGDKFNKREVYRIEHKGFINVDELRMETYLRFVARHTQEDDNVLLAFAGTKAIRACRVTTHSFCLRRFRTAVRKSNGVTDTGLMPVEKSTFERQFETCS